MDTADPTLRLERFCTGVVTDIARNTEAARKMWMDICSSRKVCAEAWVLFAEFEQVHGSAEDARNVYRRASQRRLDNLERVFSAWIAFEHLYGNVETMWSAEEVINTQRHVEWRRIEKAAAASTADGAFQNDTSGEVAEPAAAGADNADAAEGRIDRTETTNRVRAAKRRRAEDDDGLSEAGDRPGQENKVVFISGLPLSCTEADINAFIGGPATVGQIEMLANRDGQFRGQAKAALGSTDAVIAALDRSGQKMGDSFVSVHIFKQHGQLQKARGESTVKVSGFSAETGNKKLEEIAKGSGAAVVRVRRNQGGDVAFVTVRTRRDAHKAAGVLNGSVVDGKALSAQVERDDAGGRLSSDKQHSDKNTTKATAGLAKAAAAETAVPKTSMKAGSDAAPMLIPRKTASKKQQPSRRLNLARKAADDSARAKDGESEAGSKKTERTNDDFRRLFAGKGAE
ncbi:Splicing factor [Coemansia erecta]|uniref:Splicing factor n=1 Tax=Coemansia erecta TaxID=147472 RepID=A0A9W7Y712_9FUNG|nr:Splicing factor [Coemansia erecta]